MAHDVAVHVYLGEDSACNFASSRAQTHALSCIVDLQWWGGAKENGGARDPHVPAAVKSEHGGKDEVADPSVEKRQRGGWVEEDSGTDDVRSKKPKLSPVLGERVIVELDEEQEETKEWGDAEWNTFRKRLARETAAAEATEASLRRSKLRSRF